MAAEHDLSGGRFEQGSPDYEDGICSSLQSILRSFVDYSTSISRPFSFLGTEATQEDTETASTVLDLMDMDERSDEAVTFRSGAQEAVAINSSVVLLVPGLCTDAGEAALSKQLMRVPGVREVSYNRKLKIVSVAGIYLDTQSVLQGAQMEGWPESFLWGNNPRH